MLESFERHLRSHGCETNVIGYCKCGTARSDGEPLRLSDGRALCTHTLPNVGRDGHTFLHHMATYRGRFAQHTLFVNGGAVSKGWLRRRSWQMLAAFVEGGAAAEFADCGGFVSAGPADGVGTMQLDTLPAALPLPGAAAGTSPLHHARGARHAAGSGNAGNASQALSPPPTSAAAEAFVHDLAVRCADDPRTQNHGWGSAATGWGRLFSPPPGTPCCQAWCGPVECCPAFAVVCPAGQVFLWQEQTHCAWRGGTLQNYQLPEGVNPGEGEAPGYQSELQPADPPNFLLWAQREWGVSPQARGKRGRRPFPPLPLLPRAAPDSDSHRCPASSLRLSPQDFLACGWAYGNVFVASKARLEEVPPHLLARAEAALAAGGRNGGVLGHYYERFFRSMLGCRRSRQHGVQDDEDEARGATAAAGDDEQLARQRRRRGE